jgi:hypothetical protein
VHKDSVGSFYTQTKYYKGTITSAKDSEESKGKGSPQFKNSIDSFKSGNKSPMPKKEVGLFKTVLKQAASRSSEGKPNLIQMGSFPSIGDSNGDEIVDELHNEINIGTPKNISSSNSSKKSSSIHSPSSLRNALLTPENRSSESKTPTPKNEKSLFRRIEREKKD